MTIIEVKDLVKHYRRVEAVNGVSFTVARGEVFGILGRNGAGKTTVVECLEGLRRPDSGMVRVLGFDPARRDTPLRGRIGVQLQQARLPDAIKVWEALDLYASFYEAPRDWRILLDDWGLAEKRDARFAKLSGGQRQRLFIALALVGGPDVVFFDELTAGLDPQARRATWESVTRIRAEGVTVVLVSHFMDEVEALCDRVAVIDKGTVAAVDTPGSLIARSGVPQRFGFRPLGTVEPGRLERLPGVRSVAREGATIVVTGSGDIADTVARDLARSGVGLAESRVRPPTLDDAFAALTGEDH